MRNKTEEKSKVNEQSRTNKERNVSVTARKQKQRKQQDKTSLLAGM